MPNVSPTDVLIVFTRFPKAGHNKTRLIPALGAEGASAFHDKLTRHLLGRASAYISTNTNSVLEVWLDGGTPAEGRRWLGDVRCSTQGSGDLGQRMQQAIESAFVRGARRVVVVGTDCPCLDESVFADAFRELNQSDLVLGPATDGGYYLIGQSKLHECVFQNIAWGSARVFTQTLFAAGESGLSTALLPALSDVDLPEDLPAANRALSAGRTISIIISTLNDEAQIGDLLSYLAKSHPHQIIVADGGSSDRTVELAKLGGAMVVVDLRGRAAQMNLGASLSTGDFLLFLCADTIPPDNFETIVHQVLRQVGVSAGAFGFKLQGGGTWGFTIEWIVRIRCKILMLPSDARALFVRRYLFEHVGGYPQVPEFEALGLISTLKKFGKIRIC